MAYQRNNMQPAYTQTEVPPQQRVGTAAKQRSGTVAEQQSGATAEQRSDTALEQRHGPAIKRAHVSEDDASQPTVRATNYNAAYKMDYRTGLENQRTTDNTQVAGASRSSAASAKRPAAKNKQSSSVSFITSKEDVGASQSAQRGRKRRRATVIKTVFAVLLVVVLVIGGLFAWNRWLRYDDASDIQGSWMPEGESVAITITESEVVMSEDVSFSYTLDTFAKTIEFSFDSYNGEVTYSGSGAYEFSDDRTTLTITEEGSSGEEDAVTVLVKE